MLSSLLTPPLIPLAILSVTVVVAVLELSVSALTSLDPCRDPAMLAMRVALSNPWPLSVSPRGTAIPGGAMFARLSSLTGVTIAQSATAVYFGWTITVPG